MPLLKCYRLTPDLYLEWFDDQALLLVAERNLLLTLNRAAATLFEALAPAFAGRTFTLAEAADWLGAHYDLAVAACVEQARSLLAFALKHHLVEPVAAGSERGGNA